MKLAELRKLEECPEWLKAEDIVVSEEDIDIINGLVVWKDGIWKSGTWEYGTWEDGIWENGTWKNGIWKYGTWEDGIWKSGIWEDGTWEDGIWKKGIWKKGIWKYGTWEDGIWENGTWKNGIWKYGIWEYGTWEYGIWKYGIWEDGIWEDGHKFIYSASYKIYFNQTQKRIRIGCKEYSVERWDTYLDMSWEELYNHKNDFESFIEKDQYSEIKKGYLLAKMAIELANNIQPKVKGKEK